MAKNINRFQPTLLELPIQDINTGWHPVWKPTMLVVPWSRDINGDRIPGSEIISLTLAIENTIQIDVAGHPQSYPGLGIKPSASPDRILFRKDFTYDELEQYKYDPFNGIFYDDDGNIIDESDATKVQVTNARGITTIIDYYSDAEYYDLSSIEVNVDNLPSGRYVATWYVSYYKRIEVDGRLFCISNDEIIDKLDYNVNHPGEIHEAMVDLTPALYFTEIDKKSDPTVNLYRPLANILQDIFDESGLLHGINWVDKIPPQLSPYLSYLIDVKLPTQSFGANIDNLRRSMLRRGTELQKLKGSELAIKELFSILGFTVDIINLWANEDGTAFIAPNDNSGLIKSDLVAHTDPLVVNYSDSGFGNMEVPLLYKNEDNEIVLSAFMVKDGSQSESDLKAVIDNLITNPDSLSGSVVHASDGYLSLPDQLADIEIGRTESYTRLVMSDIESFSESHEGLPVIRFNGINYDKLMDKLDIQFADYKNLEEYSIFIFATYTRKVITVPDNLKYNMSNRFDLNIVPKSGTIESSLYDYLVDSLFSYKAFHSLLRKIGYVVSLEDFYNVSDMCVNTYLSGVNNEDKLQTPPACRDCHVDDNECSENSARGGVGENDEELRNKILDGLKEEHDRWRDVTDDWSDVDVDRVNWARSLSNVDIQIPSDFDNFGQDRVSYDLIVESNDELKIGNSYDMMYMGSYLSSIGSDDLRLDIQTIKYQILSDIVNEPVKITVLRKLNNDNYYITMNIDIDHQQDVRSKITQVDEIVSPDYCYKGRVSDEIMNASTAILKEVVRNQPCSLMQGIGVYYMIDRDKIENNNGWYDELLDASDKDLHFSNDEYWMRDLVGSPIRPSLVIERTNMISGYRLIYGGLDGSFTHPTYKLRPWDIENGCDLVNPLNYRFINTDAGIELRFDESDLSYVDNDPSDINYYSGVSSNDFIHAIYSSVSDSVYVDFDDITFTVDGNISVDNKVFNSACGDASDGYTDLVDGNPSENGDFTFDINNYGSDRSYGSDLIIDSGLSGNVTVAATYSSKLIVSDGHRYDCDCVNSCGEQRACSLDYFVDGDSRDFNNDKLDIENKISLHDVIGLKNYKYDGELSFFDLIDAEAGTVGYKDSYGILYHIDINREGNILDLSAEIFDPRVPGESEAGYVDQKRVFKKGALAKNRSIYDISDEYELIAEGSEFSIEFKQVNYGCDFNKPEFLFSNRFENLVNDDVQMFVQCGPHWVDIDDENEIESVWFADIWDSEGTVIGTDGTDGTDGICSESNFGFVDVWESYDAKKKYIRGSGVFPWSIWREPGSSWFIGFGPSGEKWYKTNYDGIDILELMNQDWESIIGEGNPSIANDGFDIILDGTEFDGRYSFSDTYNGAPLLIIEE